MLSELRSSFATYRRRRAYFAEHGHKLGVSRDDYLQLSRGNYTDVSLTEVTLFDRVFQANSAYWLLHSLEEIFVSEVYKFNTDNARPLIIDCGANWGLSVLYLKKLFPAARIVAFEADPKVFTLLKGNLDRRNLDDVELKNLAVWIRNEELSFMSEGTLGGALADLGALQANTDDGGTHPATLSAAAAKVAADVTANPADVKAIITAAVMANVPEADAIVGAGIAAARKAGWVGSFNTYLGAYKTERVKVRGVRLRDFLATQPDIDLLKIDIEGAEVDVIADCVGALSRVQRLFVEYHSVPSRPQLLHAMLEHLAQAGFRYHIKEAAQTYAFPFIRDRDVLYDLQLNIYCYR